MMGVGLTVDTAERLAIASALLAVETGDQDAIRAVASLPPDAWTIANAGAIAAVLRDALDTGEVLTLDAIADTLTLGSDDPRAVAADLRAWCDEAAETTNTAARCARVRQAHENRLVHEKLRALMAALVDRQVDAHDAARATLAELTHFASVGTSGYQPLRASLRAALEQAEARAMGQALPIPTGCQWLDGDPIHGLEPGDLMTLCMVSGHGKSAMLTSLLRSAAQLGTGVGLVSAEMTAPQMALRVLAAESRVGVTRIRTWGMDQAQIADVTEAAGRLAALPFFLDDAPCPKLRDVLARTRALVQRHPSVKLVGVDFVQLLEADEKTDNRARALDVIVKGLKGLAKELGVAVIILAQPDGKTIEARDDDRQLPELGDLAWSQTIRQLSDLILCGYRPGLAAQRKGPSDVADRVGYFAWRKNRRGALGSFSLGWHGPTTTFAPIVREEWRAFA